MAPIPSMSSALRTIGQATCGKQRGAILNSETGHFWADAGGAATVVAQWREYLVDKRLLHVTPSSKQELLDAAEDILAAHIAEWDWKAMGAHVAVAGARHQVPSPSIDSLMRAHSLDTFWPACVQLVVHVPDITVI